MPQSQTGWAIAQIAAIVVLTTLVYLPAIHGAFVWDDELLVTKNPLLRSWGGLGEIWGFGRTADYFPLTNTLFWVEWHLFGENTAGYHLLNITLHIANALLIWRVLKSLNIPGAWLAGLIFALHPVHVESVAWISELKNVLSLFWLLLCVLFFLRFLDGTAKNRRIAYLLSLGSFLLALLAKTQTVFLPVALLLCIWWREIDRNRVNECRVKAQPVGRSILDVLRQRSAWRSVAPFFAIAVVLGLITIAFQSRGLGNEEVVLGSLSRRLANASTAIWWYARQVLVPFRLMAVYPPWQFDSPRPLEWLPLGALIGLVALLWVGRERWKQSCFFGFGYFVLALLPVVGLIRLAYPRSGTLVADHFQYFGDISLIALFTGVLARSFVSERAGIKIGSRALTVVLVIAFGAGAWARSSVFRNEETLWQDNLSKNANTWQGHNRLGQLLFDRGNFVDAATHFERAVQLKPELADNHNQVGLAYCRLSRFEEGIAEYRKALRLNGQQPSSANTAAAATMRANLANALTITGNNLNELSQRHAMDGDTASAEAERANAMNRYAEAVGEYQKALEISPEHPGIHRNLGLLLVTLGRKQEAISHFEKVLQLVPNEPIAGEMLRTLQGTSP